MNTIVKAWRESVIIPTYGIGKPDKNPMFFEKRVYQGSSGVVYPNPVVEKIYDEKEDVEYIGLFLENRYLKIMILPELGGRVQMAYDKIKQRHFIYYNQVIKPALVGLTGPWISGGIEFNWPQHHRPSTFEPVDFTISENDDGSKTVWVNEVEKMFRTKGMAGFTLYPDKAYLEIRAQLYNRTNLPQTFLWWANPAVKVNDYYQSVFPPDVNAVYDHGKRDVSSFPIATGTYYKVDYSPGTDISWYKNIPVPTSYMAINSEYDFMGGYEHDSRAGVLHVANHHVSPGKKQWTWGHSDFGQAWDRNLTDEDGPYIELMTGMFTDNQPDFSWLMPYEEKSFTQYFLPYHELGLVKNATKDILVNIEKLKDIVVLKIHVTSAQSGNKVKVFLSNKLVFEEVANMSPENVFHREVQFTDSWNEEEILVIVSSSTDQEIIRYEPAKNRKNDMPDAASPAMAPEDAENNEQLFLTGQHLEQYRHATFSPVPYYEEALKRDARDVRNNNALGVWYLRRGQFNKSEAYFRKAIETLTQRNPNPYDSEPYYNLGLSLKYLGETDEAYTAFYKAAWSSGWQDCSYFSLAQIDIAKGDFEEALEHVNYSLDRNARNSKAYVLKSAIFRKLGRFEESIIACIEALERDPFNLGALFEKMYSYKALGRDDTSYNMLQEFLELSRSYSNNLLEYALDYSSAGLFNEAIDLLSHSYINGYSPMVDYHIGYFHQLLGNTDLALTHFKKASAADSYLCFPNRLEDIFALQAAMESNPEDAMAPYYLGNLWYDKRQYNEAIASWERSAQKATHFPTVFRNLGIAYYNKQSDHQKALKYFEKAFYLDTTDARVLMELDQLYKRLNKLPEERLAFLEKHLTTVEQRDDLYLERLSLYNFLGEYEKAFNLIMARKFHPWEGGEGKVSDQYVYSLVEMAKKNVYAGDYQNAILLLTEAQKYPTNLGEGKLYGTLENDVFYWLGCASEGANGPEKAIEYFKKATIGMSEPGVALFYNDQQPDKMFYQGLAWQKLGERRLADEIFRKLKEYGETHLNQKQQIDYFAVSLPDLLIFEDDLQLKNNSHCYYLIGLGCLGLQLYSESEDALNSALQINNSLKGAQTALKLANHIKNTTDTI